MVREDMVKRIQQATKDVQRAQNRRDSLVRRAREQGATWTQIGYALGITAQGAQKRYGDTQERVDAYQANLRKRAEKRAQKAKTQERSSDEPWPDGTVQERIEPDPGSPE